MKKILFYLGLTTILMNISGCDLALDIASDKAVSFVQNGMKEQQFNVKYSQEHPEIKPLLTNYRIVKSKVGYGEYIPETDGDKLIWSTYLKEKEKFLKKI